MNSRERVLAAARREQTDRPPTSLRCTPEAWESLRKYLGVCTNNDVLDELGIDLRWVSLPFIGPTDRTASPLEAEGTDFWGCHTRKVINDFNSYFEFDFHPLAKARSVEDVARHAWPIFDSLKIRYVDNQRVKWCRKVLGTTFPELQIFHSCRNVAGTATPAARIALWA